MIFEWVTKAVEAKKMWFSAVSETVVKDRERCYLLIHLIVRRREVILCKSGSRF